MLHDETQPRVCLRLARDRLRSAHLAEHAATEVCAQDHVGVEHRDEPVEVALACRGEEGVHDVALALQVRVGHRSLTLHPPSGAACELSRRLR